uniref:Uncharacterized protein n=1 Tax=Physcomitrium patens TaxID=3218 RepID=A0A2K1JQY1_PHYPA|nr:hypothetical protein PHYPA_016326 [Physcomitrium patens]
MILHTCGFLTLHCKRERIPEGYDYEEGEAIYCAVTGLPEMDIMEAGTLITSPDDLQAVRRIAAACSNHVDEDE